MEGLSVIIVCAWCEAEGKPAVLYQTLDDSPLSVQTQSHGICQAHCDQLLLDLQGSFPDAVLTSHPAGSETVFLNALNARSS
jgi:hypothetical protein